RGFIGPRAADAQPEFAVGSDAGYSFDQRTQTFEPAQLANEHRVINWATAAERRKVSPAKAVEHHMRRAGRFADLCGECAFAEMRLEQDAIAARHQEPFEPKEQGACGLAPAVMQ